MAPDHHANGMHCVDGSDFQYASLFKLRGWSEAMVAWMDCRQRSLLKVLAFTGTICQSVRFLANRAEERLQEAVPEREEDRLGEARAKAPCRNRQNRHSSCLASFLIKRSLTIGRDAGVNKG